MLDKINDITKNLLEVLTSLKVEIQNTEANKTRSELKEKQLGSIEKNLDERERNLIANEDLATLRDKAVEASKRADKSKAELRQAQEDFDTYVLNKKQEITIKENELAEQSKLYKRDSDDLRKREIKLEEDTKTYKEKVVKALQDKL